MMQEAPRHPWKGGIIWESLSYQYHNAFKAAVTVRMRGWRRYTEGQMREMEYKFHGWNREMERDCGVMGAPKE